MGVVKSPHRRIWYSVGKAQSLRSSNRWSCLGPCFSPCTSTARAKRAFCSTPWRISLATICGVGVFGKRSRTNPRDRFSLPSRSEEHTSELQSHHDLVCRLLLEKKKNNTTQCNI